MRIFHRLRLLAILIAVFASSASAQQRIPVAGVVRDAATREPVAGATVRLENGRRGTYTSRTGVFRLPLERGTHRLVISSIGYEPRIVTVSTESTRIDVDLKATPVHLGGVSITADLTGEEVVRNAIARKRENQERLRTFSGILYSKFTLDLDGNVFGEITDDERAIILETFSRYWYDATRTPDTRIEVIQRRQTANIPAESNLFALGSFMSFYVDEITLLNATLLTPLADDAFSRYRYEIIDRTMLEGQLVYVVKIIPTTRVLPAFEGTMKIVKGTYNLVEIDVQPTGSTAIAFINDLRFAQRFERQNDSVWYPTLLDVSGSGTLEVVKGLAVVDGAFHARSIFTESATNEPIADSVFADRKLITAAADADSARTEFWENNSLSELSAEEKETYQRIDSLVANADTTDSAATTHSFNFGPHIEFNRVSGFELGGSLGLDLTFVQVNATAGYAMSLRRPLFSGSVTLPIIRGPVSLRVFGSASSMLNSGYFDRSYPNVINSISSLFFHRDYYDWYRQRGWSAGIDAGLMGVRINAAYHRQEHFAESERVQRSIFTKGSLRDNPEIPSGVYEIIDARVSAGRSEGAIAIASGVTSEFGIEFIGVTGRRDKGEWFGAVEGRANVELPTISTGYLPMTLRVALQAGTSSGSLPLHYQFRQRTGLTIVSPFGHFMTAPIGIYGGDGYLAAHAEHNFNDLIWRWLGLPTYEGRGLEFIISGAAGRWDSEPGDTAAPAGVRTGGLAIRGRYFPTGDEWYAEAGVGLGKIPTFISNVAFLRLDARMGVGRIAGRNWGLGLTLSTPF